jgi:putative chitinase
MDIQKLKGHIPDTVLAELPLLVEKFECNTVNRMAHFLGQASHESGGFKATKENLNYSAEGLVKIFGKYFTAATAPAYARNPEKIANRVYANRMGNGDEKSGDGFKHRGFGYLQTTGKANQCEFADFIGDPEVKNNPELIATKYPLASAGFFFWKNKLWAICDKGMGDDVITSVTKRVNGGSIGIIDRIKHTKEYYGFLNS